MLKRTAENQKRRKSPAEDNEEDGKRSRGRPTLYTNDETAAERRRTQIRLAQRAYRNRKENAIQSLDKRVQELKETNEAMSNAFMKLHDIAIKSGLLDRAPSFADQLHSTTQIFLSLAQHRNGTPQLLLEPRQQIDPIMLHSTIPQSSTQREPSAFELVEVTAKPRALDKCSKCHNEGHRMNSRACPMRYEELRVQFALQATAPAALPTQPPAEAIPPQPSSIYISSNLPSPTSASSSTSSPTLSPPPRYDDPRSIYHRYVQARDTWYKAQPRGSVKSNQQYRRAMGLPLRYDKASYEWCMDYKQMTKRCTASTGSRDWTKEEMMAYLDWSKAEDDRIEAQAQQEMEDNPFETGRIGVHEIWRRIEKDIEDLNQDKSCILVGS